MTNTTPHTRTPLAVLFDVDGCLISTGGAGTKAWRLDAGLLIGIVSGRCGLRAPDPGISVSTHRQLMPSSD